MMFEKDPEHPTFDYSVVDGNKVIDLNVLSMMMSGSNNISWMSIPDKGHDFAFALNTRREICSLGGALVETDKYYNESFCLFDEDHSTISSF